MPSSTKVTIHTPRLLLRGAIPDDAVPLYPIFADGESMAFWSTPPHSTISQTQKWVAGMIAAEEVNGVTDFIIVEKATATPIGKMGIWTPTSPSGELGFIIARSHWRKGLGSEALGALLGYFFNQKGFTTITADVDPGNQASLKLLQKSGLVETGRKEKTYNIDGVWMDSVYLALVKDEWDHNLAVPYTVEQVPPVAIGETDDTKRLSEP